MSRSIFALLFFLFVGGAALSFPADSVNDWRIKIGAKFGAEKAGYLALSSQRFTVYNGGVQVVKRVSQKWSIESGLYQTSKIVEFSGEKINYRFLTLPVNARLEMQSLYLTAGPYVEYLVLVNLGQSAYNPGKLVRKFQQGLNLSAGYEFRLGSHWNTFVEARYIRSVFAPAGFTHFVSTGISAGVNRRF